MISLKKIIFSSIIFITSVNFKVYPNIKTILTTTGIVADAVKNVVIDNYKVLSLMGAGVDPHGYKPTAGDLIKLKKADIIFYNGLHLEGKMDYIFKNLAQVKSIYAVSDCIDINDLIKDPEFEYGIDPHIWFDINLWQKVVGYISNIMQKEDPANADKYIINSTNYINKLKILNNMITEELETIPKENKFLITPHDAFSYFARAYDIKVKSLQGISTMSDYGLKDKMELVEFIIKNKVKAIFIETSVADKSLRSIVEVCKLRGHQVQLGDALYSDAMGPEYTDEGTYEGMISFNTRTIVKYLK